MKYLNTVFSRIMDIGPVQRQSIISFIWQILFTFIGFLSTMYFAHAVGASVLGAYFLLIAYLSVISMISDGGFGSAAVKRISEGEEQDAYFSAYVVLRSLFVTIVVIVLLLFRGYFVDINNAGTFTWLIVALVVSIIGGAISSGIAGCGKMGIHATGNFIDNISRIIVQVIAVFFGYGVAGLAGGVVLGMLVGSIVQLRFLDLHLVSFDWSHLKSLFTFSFWIFLISGGSVVFMNADTVMIGYYLNDTEVGIYRVILQFTVLAAFTTIALRGTLLPKVSRWGKIEENGLIEDSLSRAFTYSLILAVPLIAGGFLLGDRLLYFFYGPDFVNYGTLMILFVVQAVNIFQYFFTTYLIALDHLKKLFRITVLTVIANIILNALLIPQIGIIGAAIATLVTMTIYAVLARQELSKIIMVRVEHGSLVSIMKASIVMSMFVGGYRLLVPLSNVWLTLIPIAIGSIIYVILVMKFDSKIYEELKGILLKMNVPWPEWL